MTSYEVGTKESHAFEASAVFAAKLDSEDSLRQLREQFLFPKAPNGSDCLYLAGNSLGLQPKKARTYIEEELEDWAKHGVEGHFIARHPWLPYHENLTEMTARLVGAKPIEVVVMNTLTVNLHLMMVSFYRPTKTRFKILIEKNSFPSDKYAVDSQARFHGLAPNEAVIEQAPRAGESTWRTEDILETIEKQGDSIALVMLGQVNYLTGQAFAMETITRAAHAKGCLVGYNLAHGAGNLLLKLHDWDVDFAVWCGYKYLNSGPGALAGCFVHERHAQSFDLPRFAGWWGHDKVSRFQMGPNFQPIAGAEGWQLSNPPIFQLAALRASMELFDQATMVALRAKSEKLTGYLEYLLKRIPDNFVTVTTPADPAARGCQLSTRVKGHPKQMLEYLTANGAVCDFREPDIIRVAPTPMYNSFSDVYRFAEMVAEYAAGRK
jgi:kynureninase